MVMELLDGSDLAELLAAQGPLTLEASVGLVLQACEAVAEAHACGIVHRDLKPQNLFLTRTVNGSPKVKVLDFGVSKAVGIASGGMGALTQTRAMLGSPLYMAPEQMRSSRDVDARVDVWALGVVLFELLTGRWPFEAETMPELCLKVVSDPPLSLETLRPDMPAEFVAIVARCLEKDPAKRYANAAELATALEPFAPVDSRVLAEHARMAIRRPLPGSHDRPAMSPNMPTLASPEIEVRPASFPSAWGGSLEDSSPQSKSRRRAAGWSIGGGLVLAFAAVLVFVVGGRRPVQSPGAAATVHESPPEPVIAPPPPAVVSLSPAPTPAPLPVAEIPAPAPAAAPVRDAGARPAVVVRSPPGARTTAPSPQGHSGPNDDDIPALR
jgi:serine/threonine-protein kinase